MLPTRAVFCLSPHWYILDMHACEPCNAILHLRKCILLLGVLRHMDILSLPQLTDIKFEQDHLQ